MNRKEYIRYTRTQLILGVLLVIAIAAGGSIAVVSYLQSRKSGIIPSSIQQHIAFQVYAPSTTSTWAIDTNSISYNSTQGVLSLVVSSSTNTFALEEQQTPSIFTNVAQYYPTLLSKLNVYGNFQTGLGTVELTKPTELHGGQTAVLNSAGTLLFVRPKSNLTNGQWNKFFSSIVVIK